MTNDNLAQLAINTIRTLSIDAVQAAKSGHPDTPMALRAPRESETRGRQFKSKRSLRSDMAGFRL